MIKRLQAAFVFLLVIISYNFFEATFIKSSAANYFIFLYLLIAIVIAIPNFFLEKNIGFVLPVRILFVSMSFSILMAYLSWEQSIFDGLIETVPYLTWIFFFYLLYIKFPIETVEKIIVAYSFIYILLYFFQLANSHTVYFGNIQEYVQSRGVIRVVFPGGGVLFLAAFMAVNKLTTEKTYKFLWLTLTFFGLVIAILQVTRQFIVGVVLIYLFHFTKKMSLYKRVLLVSFVGLCGFLYITTADNSIVNGLMEEQEKDAEKEEDYIRILAAEYFLMDFSPEPMNQIFGNGVGRYGESDYGKFMESLNEVEEYFLEDIGLIGVYAMFGIFPILAFIIIWIKSFIIPLPEKYQYLKYYLWFLLITCITSYNVYHPHYLTCTVLVLFIYQSILKRTVEVSGIGKKKVKIYIPDGMNIYKGEEASARQSLIVEDSEVSVK